LGLEEEGRRAEEKAAILIQSRKCVSFNLKNVLTVSLVVPHGFCTGFRGFMERKKWGPILEERVKEILATHESKEMAKEALRVRRLNLCFLQKYSKFLLVG